MSYFVVEDFRLGLDARKHILALPPGSLYFGKNANISRGGELESAKAFVSKFALPAAQTFGLVAASGKLYVFGSVAAPVLSDGINYQRLQHPSATAMTGIVHAAVVKGKIFAIATFVGGLGVFFNGAIVTDWLPSGAGITSYTDVATNFAGVIAANPIYLTSHAGPVVTITGQPSVSFSAAASATNGGGANDQSATVTLAQAATTGGGEVLATGTITIPVVNPGDLMNFVNTNGVLLLSRDIAGNTDVLMAQAVAAEINSFATAPNYSATAAGNVVTISASPGAGSAPNGFLVTCGGSFLAGIPPTGSVMAGGSNASSGLPQITTVAFAGTWEAADTYSITLGGVVFLISGTGANGQLPTFLLTKRSKSYAIAGPNLFGSKIGDATAWNSGTGSFVTDMSNELEGAETLTAMAPFQGNTAIFSRSTTQIWALDPDPANNDQLQVLQNIGTLAPKSVKAFGDSDVFFLSDTGLRSLKVRLNTNNATLSDIGSPIDPLIIAAIKAAGVSAASAVSALEPVDGRFMLHIGKITYVFSFFPSGKISGWTTYENGLSITDFAVVGTRLYARAGDFVYLLGGDNNDTYSQQPLDVKLPFLNAHQIATLKHFTGLDVACDGTLVVSIATDPNSPDNEEEIATITQSTYGLGADPFNGEDTTAISLRFQGRAGEYCRIANIVVHYEPLGEAVTT